MPVQKHSSSFVPHWQSTDFEIQSTQEIYKGHFTFKLYQLRYRLFSGEWASWVERLQVTPKNAAAVVLYDLKLDKVVMVEQFRVGAMMQQEQSPWLLELVAGYIEPNESSEEAVRRESIEEARCTIKTLIPVGRYFTSPGGSTELTSLFCGIIDAQELGGLSGNIEEQEDIKIHVLPALEVFELIEQGMLTSSSTIIGLQWLKIHREALRSVDYS